MASKSYQKIGEPAPEFSGNAMVDDQFKQISLKNYRGKVRRFVLLFIGFV